MPTQAKLPSHPADGTESSPNPELQVRFWGVRGSIPTPGPTTVHYGGNTSCLEVRAGHQILILDAGTGLRGLGQALVAEFGDGPVDLTLLLTHTHWDHIQGIPFFLPVYKPQYRVRILGYEGARHGLENVVTSQMESPFFPIAFREVPGNVEIEELKQMEFRLGKVQVAAFRAFHPGTCMGYRLSYGGASVCFFPDNELPIAGNTETVRRASGRPPANPGGSLREDLNHFVHGTDVLIMDSQYDRAEYQEHVGWGHGCLDEVVSLALIAEAKQLYLFHHDPDHDDAKIASMTETARELVAARRGTLEVDAAREGAVVCVPEALKR